MRLKNSHDPQILVKPHAFSYNKVLEYQMLTNGTKK
jgi:hypothetical protein